MTFTVSSRRTALACAFVAFPLACSAAQAAGDQNLTPILVTASRFPNDPAFPPVGATVIGAEDIRNAGIDNVNEAIRKLGGVYGRQNALGTSDLSLDLRGFGDTSDQNIVVMVDGIRLSDNEQVSALLSTIPVESVERIEIVRGGSSVLYGDGATGGTIQIITRRPAANTSRGTVVTEVGDHGLRSARAFVSKGWDGFSIDAAYGKQHADNFRSNNQANQENFSGGMQWFSGEGRFGLRIDLAHADYGLAGPLSLAQFQANPRQSLTPLDNGAYDSNRITAFAERRFGNVELATELSHREKQSKMFQDFGAFGVSRVEKNSRVTQFSPRLRHQATGESIRNEFVAGVDLAEWNINDAFSTAYGAQRSKALYARDEVQFAGNARVALGVRRELFQQRAFDPAASSYTASQALNAWELQASHAVIEDARLFAKTGQSYRVANVDDNRYTNTFNQALKPQLSHDAELGATFGKADRTLTVKWFEHHLTNEIMFDPTTFTNINLDPTRRRGVELDGKLRLTQTLSATAGYQHVEASFRSGANAGKDVVLVPKNMLTARLNWQSGNQTASAGAQWVDRQRYGNDFSNSCSTTMPSYTTLDARYALRASAWEFAMAGSNLAGKDYFSRAYGCRGNIYPDAGRQLKFTARYDF